MTANEKVAGAVVAEGVSNNGTDFDAANVNQAVEAVPEQYRGTTTDKHDMAVMGKKQVLRRSFNFATMLAFASMGMCSWEYLLPLFTYTLLDGGTAGCFWGFIGLACGQTLVYASIAEMASISPTAGGQYHWVSEFAPRRFQKFLSYLTGWFTTLGWQVYLAGSAFVAGSCVQGLIALNYDSYVWKQWHGTLLTFAVLAVSVFANTTMANYLAITEGCMLVLHILGWLAIIVPLWVTAPHGSAKEVLLTFSNDGGWSSTGLATMIGITAFIGPFVGYDCSVHMSEELRNSSRETPRALMSACGLNFLMMGGIISVLIFSTGDINDILTTRTGQPFIQLIFNATRSYGATNTMVSIMILLYTGGCINLVATSSRQLWSFSRDRGFPRSEFLSQIDTKRNIPLRAIWTIVVVAGLISCINLGSSVALNAFNSFGGVAVLSSYYLSVGCVIYRRLVGPPLPPRQWSLGRFGLLINVTALLFLTPLWFFVWWPLFTPVTAANMNWASVMCAGAMLITVGYYFFRARHGRYVGPVVIVKRE